jgi:hypothetical protein
VDGGLQGLVADGQRRSVRAADSARRYSRYLPTVVACSAKKSDLRPIFERLFRRHGVPKAIQCDSGVPFVDLPPES